MSNQLEMLKLLKGELIKDSLKLENFFAGLVVLFSGNLILDSKSASFLNAIIILLTFLSGYIGVKFVKKGELKSKKSDTEHLLNVRKVITRLKEIYESKINDLNDTAAVLKTENSKLLDKLSIFEKLIKQLTVKKDDADDTLNEFNIQK